MEKTFKNALAFCNTNRWVGTKDGPRSYRNAVRMLSECYGGNMVLVATYYDTPVESLTYQKVTAAVEALKKSGLKSATINRHLSALSAVLDEAHKLWGIPKIPLPFGPESAGRKETLTREEFEKLVAALEARVTEYARFARFLVMSGMRLSEAANIRFSDLMDDGSDGIIVKLKNTKNGKDRFVPVPGMSYNGNRAYSSEEADDPLFNLDVRAFQRAFKEAADRLFPGREIVPHTLRHTCASWMVAADVPLHVVSDFLGHKSLMTTRRYAHNATNALREAALKIFK